MEYGKRRSFINIFEINIFIIQELFVLIAIFFIIYKYILKTIAVNNIYEDINASCTLTEGTDSQVFANVTTSGGYGELKFSYLDKDTYSAFTKEKLYYFKNKAYGFIWKIKE